MPRKMDIDRLKSYIFIRREVENQLERLVRMKNQELIPAMSESDGSQRTSSASDRMANAIVRRITYEEQISADMEAKMAEMDAIRGAVDGLRDSMEREVLRLRYLDGAGYRLTNWRDIAKKLYGDDDEKWMQAVYRLHRRAIESIGKVEA